MEQEHDAFQALTPEELEALLKKHEISVGEILAADESDIETTSKFWSNGLRFFRLLIHLGQELVNSRLERHSYSQNQLINVSTRLAARSILTSREVYILANSGCADGAFARWRTLYEQNILLMFMYEHGEAAAKAYIDAAACRAKKSLITAERYASEFGGLEYSNEDRRRILELDAQARARNPPKFARSDWNWASPFLETRKEVVSFDDIAAETDLKSMKPYVTGAHQAVHASPISLFHPLATEKLPPDLVLMGSSPFGVSAPCRLASFCLSMSCGVHGIILEQFQEAKVSEVDEGLVLEMFRVSASLLAEFQTHEAELESDRDRVFKDLAN